jgi:hypothetical protein
MANCWLFLFPYPVVTHPDFVLLLVVLLFAARLERYLLLTVGSLSIPRFSVGTKIESLAEDEFPTVRRDVVALAIGFDDSTQTVLGIPHQFSM